MKRFFFVFLFLLSSWEDAKIFDKLIVQGGDIIRNPHNDLGQCERIPKGISNARAMPKLSVHGWRASGRHSFYFPSISFLSGFPSAFPLILKQERSLARAVSKRVAVVFQAHGSVEVLTGKDKSGEWRTTVRAG